MTLPAEGAQAMPPEVESEVLGRGRMRVEWRASIAVAALALVAVTVHTLAYTMVSPIDEFQHIDYLYRAADFEVVRAGDRAGPEVFAEIDVRGLDAVGVTAGSYNTAYIHPPTYYWVTAQAGRLVQALTGVDSLVTAARLLGGVWLAAGLILLWHVARNCGAGLAAGAGVVLLVGSAPGVLHSSATVGPDATAIACGGFALLALTVWERRNGLGLGLLFAAGLASTAFKFTHAVAVLLVGAYLLTLALRVGRRAAPLKALGALVVGTIVPLATWTLLTGALARVDPASLPQAEQFVVEGLGLGSVVINSTQFLTPLALHVPDRLMLAGVATVRTLGAWLLSLGTFGAVLFGRSRAALDRLAGLLAVVLLAAPPLLVIVTYARYGAYFGIPRRYALALVPALALVLALVARTERARRLLVVAGVVSALVVLSTMLHVAA